MVYNLYIETVTGPSNVTIADGTLNTTTTSLALPGKNTPNFGLPLNQDLIRLLQNFAGNNVPPNAVIGQLWYETQSGTLKIYNGSTWTSLIPSFDSHAGSHSVQITVGVNQYYMTVLLSDEKIVSIISETAFSPAQLPATITIGSESYDLSIRFPQGVSQGLTMATESGGNLFAMTGIATQSQQLATARHISLNGDVAGSALFDGSQNITISSSLSNLNVAGRYNQVVVDNTGRVTGGNVNLGNADIITALGYTPVGDISLVGDVTSFTDTSGSSYVVNVSIGNSTVTPGTYNSVTVDQRGIVTAAAVSMDLPQIGIILWPQAQAVPTNFAVCNGQTVTGAGNLVITTPNLTAYNIGTTKFIMRIA